MVNQRLKDGRLGSDEPTALAPLRGQAPSGLEQSRSSTDAALPEIQRRALNLRCAGNVAGGPLEEAEFFAPKVRVTCLKTADWLEDVISPALEALRDAGNTFQHYARLHQNKGTPEGRRKAAVNEEFATKCFAAFEAVILASVDTRPQGGDANAAPFTSGAVPEGQTPNTSQGPNP